MATPIQVTDRFYNITGFDIQSYLQSYVDFVTFDQPNIVAYYSGTIDKPNAVSFSKLQSLIKKATLFNATVRLNATRFISAEDWDLYERIEDVRIKLWSLDQASKWLRSAITNNQFSNTIETDYATTQFQTIEGVSRNVENSNNPNDDFVQLALRNDLNEEKYDTDGGTLLKVQLSNAGSSVIINSVVDNLIGERMYGLDIDRTLTFADNDLKVLSYQQTMLQAIGILANLHQNDNPEFPRHGIQQNIIVGTSRGSLLFPVLFRQLANTFKTDDTLSSFAIINISYQQDAVHLEYEIQTKYGDTFTNTIAL